MDPQTLQIKLCFRYEKLSIYLSLDFLLEYVGNIDDEDCCVSHLCSIMIILGLFVEIRPNN
jgi:hypothetical protein